MSTYVERRRLAEAHMAVAKAKFSEAARASMQGDPRSRELACEAFDAVEAARAELRALEPADAPGRAR